MVLHKGQQYSDAWLEEQHERSNSLAYFGTVKTTEHAWLASLFNHASPTGKSTWAWNAIGIDSKLFCAFKECYSCDYITMGNTKTFKASFNFCLTLTFPLLWTCTGARREGSCQSSWHKKQLTRTYGLSEDEDPVHRRIMFEVQGRNHRSLTELYTQHLSEYTHHTLLSLFFLGSHTLKQTCRSHIFLNWNEAWLHCYTADAGGFKKTTTARSIFSAILPSKRENFELDLSHYNVNYLMHKMPYSALSNQW